MKHSTSGEVNICSNSLERTPILWKPRCYYVQKDPQLVLVQRIRPYLRHCVTFRRMLFFLQCSAFSHSPNTKVGGQPLVSCPRLPIQYIRSYLPHLKTVFSIPSLRTHHVVTGTQLTWSFIFH
jgi:hypothetical protein